MPELSVCGRMPLHPLVDQIIQGKAIWRVSALALTYRLRELGMLDESEYRSACVELSKRGYRRAERSELVRETSQLLGKVLGLLRGQGRGPREIAVDLGLNQDEVVSMMFGLVVTAIGKAERLLGGTCVRNRAIAAPGQAQPGVIDLQGRRRRHSQPVG